MTDSEETFGACMATFEDGPLQGQSIRWVWPPGKLFRVPCFDQQGVWFTYKLKSTALGRRKVDLANVVYHGVIA